MSTDTTLKSGKGNQEELVRVTVGLCVNSQFYQKSELIPGPCKQAQKKQSQDESMPQKGLEQVGGKGFIS